jgi:peptidoglycan/LPS O-acetylase OafA/YrhL
MTSPDAIARLPDGGRFVALDSLRGIAALWVAAFHVNGGGPLLRSTFIANGWLMVDFFFVLSGFVMAAAYRDTMAGGMPLRRYAILRLGRVYPLHAAVLGAYLAFELGLWVFGRTGAHVAFTGDHSPGSLLLMAALLQGFAWPELTGWNTQSWSIAVEVWLYLAIALLWRRFGARA